MDDAVQKVSSRMGMQAICKKSNKGEVYVNNANVRLNSVRHDAGARLTQMGGLTPWRD